MRGWAKVSFARAVRLGGGRRGRHRRLGGAAPGQTGDRRRRLGLAGVVGLLIAVPAAACNSTLVSNQTVSVCYRAIPVGRAAVHDPRAILLGVHRVSAERVRAHLPAPARAELGPGDRTTVCAMAFKGTFAAGQVERAPRDEVGDYALVIVTAEKLQLLGAAVFQHPPRGFGGRVV